MVGLAMNILPLLGFTSNKYKSRKMIANVLFDVWADCGYYASVRAGALEGWIMAVCNMSMQQKGGVFFSKAIPPLIEIFEEEPSPEMADLMKAAGSAVALLYEAHFVMQFQDTTDSEDTDDIDEGKTNFKYSNRDV